MPDMMKAVFLSVLCVACAHTLPAQTPASAATGPAAQSPAGFYPGWNLGVRLEDSTNSDGSVFDLGTGAGYNFSHHFGIGLGVPYYFVNSPSLVSSQNTQSVSGNGFGDVGADARWLFPGDALTYASTVHLGAPTGDKKKGFSVGHATWNWANHLEHGWGSVTPFVDLGVGNTVMDTRYFHRPFMSFGYNAQFEGGTEMDAGPFSLSASAYDVAPWGPQTVVSRVIRCTSQASCSATGKSSNRKGYLSSNVTSGDASLVRDNGFNANAEFKPVRNLDLEVDFSRSVPLKLNTFSFGLGLDFGGFLRHARAGK
jgi:hypothetical protein